SARRVITAPMVTETYGHVKATVLPVVEVAIPSKKRQFLTDLLSCDGGRPSRGWDSPRRPHSGCTQATPTLIDSRDGPLGPIRTIHDSRDDIPGGPARREGRHGERRPGHLW